MQRSILAAETATEFDPADAPSVEDFEWAAETSPFADEWHTDEPTPDEALEDTTDYDTWPDWAQRERWEPTEADLDDEAEAPWWDAMTDAELQAVWDESFAGGGPGF